MIEVIYIDREMRQHLVEKTMEQSNLGIILAHIGSIQLMGAEGDAKVSSRETRA